MPGFTVSAAARLCGVERRTIQRAIQAGRLHLDAQHCLSREALVAAGYLDAAPAPHNTTHETPHETPQELSLVTALLAHLEQLTRTIVALHQEVILLREDLRRTPLRTPQATTHRMRQAAAPQVEPHGTPQRAPHEVRHAAGYDAGRDTPVPHHDALLPQDMTQVETQVEPHDTAAPQVEPHDTPQRTPYGTSHAKPATAPTPETLPPYVQRIAEVAAEYDKLSLAELSQLLYDRNIYRAHDRKTRAEKPVNKGTLQHWLAQARQAGVL